jgi:hypothetical protein
MSSGFVVGQPAQYVVGLKGTVTEKTDDTVTIDGITMPLRLTPDGPVKHLTTQWPLDPDDVIEKLADRNQQVQNVERDLTAVSDDLAAAERENHALIDAITQLHDEHHQDPQTVCQHEVCRRWGR